MPLRQNPDVEFLREHSDEPVVDIREAERLTARAMACGVAEDERVRLLGQASELYRRAGELGPAVALGERALGSVHRCNDERLSVITRIRLATAQFYAGEHRVAAKVLEQAAEDAADLGDDLLRSFALQHLGKCLVEAGRIPKGRAALTAAAALRFELNQPSLLGSSLRALVELERRAAANELRRRDDERAVAGGL